MEDRSKENNRQVANNNKGVKTPSAVDRRVSRVAKTPSFTCSPVREEDGEVFEEDTLALERSLTRDYKMSRRSEIIKRRQTLGGMTTSARRISVGNNTSSSTVKKPRGRRSFGNSSTSSASGLSSYEQHAMNDLKDELNKREKLDHTRQHRLNALDIKRREAENRLEQLQAKFRELKKEKADVVRQNNELKRQNKQLLAGKRRLEDQKKQQDQTITTLLAKVGNGALRRKPLRQPSSAHSNKSSTNKTQATARSSSSTAGSPTEDQGETFGDGEEVLSSIKRSNPDPVRARRYTMAPGEVSRIRSTSQVVVKESHSIRLDCLPKGSMSKDAAEICKEYGMVVHARITKCIVTGELKGYVTFSEASAAKQAIRDLKIKGYNVIRVDDATI
mmetsp:Transcript_18813/g.34858  ORF Transcript_18813/g.34858 Transcript_18813/m.34858 type:complete len:389 (-) Transcript_18813:116-1282(-)|eukprot:CAMPEP_0184510018 /NCGR_PEP_ID=MMETSP0198_2-20121128/1589_1 /TAXON_ID=1112570 /ORGANISM="Thraustochytrium sp., Strain LLF1b" /LENGTH=388 /DNA_ID=CAMNT_0026899879 /DNA_START=423 /DNA_END=1589 /DNA_ORIENTATION=-